MTDGSKVQRSGRPIRVVALTCVLGVSGALPAWGDVSRKVARAVATDAAFSIDGRLDEPAWGTATVHSDFVERKPRLSQPPPVATSFRILRTAEALYVGVHCSDDKPAGIRGTVRGRDNMALFRDDAVSLKIDPAHDHRTTYGFTVNPVSGRVDYRSLNEAGLYVEYDLVWEAAAVRTKDGWSAEFRIPFAALSIDPASPPEAIGFNITRDHARRNASYDWALLAPEYGAVASSRYGHLVGLRSTAAQLARSAVIGAPSSPRAKRFFALTPYLLGGFRQEGPDFGEPLSIDPEYNAGLDAVVELGAGWRIQGSLNTDFAQTDLDAQVVNLSRFGLFLPEKRDFFLRDMEIYRFGREAQEQLLHTRRIGLFEDRPVPVLGGLKAVGRAGRDARVGVFNVVTRPERGLPWTSHLAARGLVELGRGSNLGVMMTHRQSFEQGADRNSVIGLDGAWRRGALLLEAFSMVSLTGSEAGEPQEAVGGAGTGDAADSPRPSVGVDLAWRGRLVRPSISYSYLHRDFRADLGFIQRTNVHRVSSALVVEPRIERYGLEKLTLTAEGGLVASADPLEMLDWDIEGRAALLWDLGYIVEVAAQRLSETVIEPFELARGTVIDAGRYEMMRMTVDVATPSVYPVGLTVSGTARGFYGGTLLGLWTEINARPSRYVRFALGGGFDRARFEDSARDFYSAILDGNVGVAFSKTIVLDLFGQWNDLADLMRVQARLRWTYLPGSNIYLVYQHDLDDEQHFTRSQSLLLKATYRWP